MRKQVLIHFLKTLSRVRNMIMWKLWNFDAATVLVKYFLNSQL